MKPSALVGLGVVLVAAASVATSLMPACAGPPRTASEPPRVRPAPVVVEPAPDPLPSSAQPAAPALEDESLAEWQRLLDEQLTSPARADAEIVLLGGTTAHGWGRSRAFRKQWSDRRVLALGSPGDGTQHVLFRIERGVLDGLEPQLLLLLVGGENLARGASVKETVIGVRHVLARVRQKLPRVPVLVVGLLPAGEQPADAARVETDAANRSLETLSGKDRVIVLDVGAALLSSDGRLDDRLLAGSLEPTPLGYDVLGQTLGLVAHGLLQGRL